MATIQVRNISEEAYEIIRKRARAAGQSIQAYMREAIEFLAREPDDDEFWAELKEFQSAHSLGVSIEAILEALDEVRR